jgi:threonine dehydrogenase-like Zn-dependent dehydrogenase
MLPQRRLVVAVETKPDRTALAKKFDADVVVDPTRSHRPSLPLCRGRACVSSEGHEGREQQAADYV